LLRGCSAGQSARPEDVVARARAAEVGGRRVVIRRARIEEVLVLRHAELRPGRPRASACFEGDEAASTRHFAAFDAATGEALACVSFMRRPWRRRPAYQLRGMATRADLVRRGLGRALLRFAERVLRAEPGPRILWCNARLEAAAFYRKLGWTVASEPFEVPDVGPHVCMTRPLRGALRAPAPPA
jgi:GNAT superfamily N-acetyltransferase